MGEFEGKLPPSWIATTLGEVCSQPQYGYTTKGSDAGTLRLLRTTDIASGNINWDSVPFCLENPDDEDKYLLQDGDIVISRAGSVGVSYLLRNPERSVFASYLIRFKPYIDTQYFKYFLDSPYYWKEIADNKLGIAVPNVNASKLKDIAISLPPENEQHRIVAKIEELFSELDKGIEALKTAREQLKVYRQALLKHAFEGKLTAAWRAANPDKLEPAAALLARIQTEREERYQQQLQQWQTHGGSKPKAPKPLPPLTAEELAELPELPEGWGWARAEDVCSSVRDGTHDTPKYVSHGVPLVTSKNLRDGKINFSDTQFISTEDHTQISIRSGVDKDDVLYAMIGTIGNPVVVTGAETFSIKNVALFKGNPQFLDSHYLSFWLGCSVCDKVLITLELLKGTTQKFIPLGNLRILPVPICSSDEQKVIVQLLDEKLSEADQLELTLATSLQQSEALRQSILKRAFSGLLVAQDPHDEPAAVLLARIRAEHESGGKRETIQRRTKKVSA